MTEFIRLLDSTGTTVLDSVSTSYEDSFGLETFGELIQEHMKADSQGKKSFIIARVQTWDHRQPDRAFYSYYNAYHLNKILFQTQIYLGKKLIHHLHVLNPLTNSDIIGNVLYFKVVYRAAADEILTKEGSAVSVGKTVIIGSALVNESNTSPKLLKPDHGKTADDRRRTSHRKSSSRMPGLIAKETTGECASWTLSSPAVAEATEEEGNLNAKVPFPNRKYSILPHGVSPLPNFSFWADPLAKRRISRSPDGKLERQRSSTLSHPLRPPADGDVPLLQVIEDTSIPKPDRRRTVSYEARSKPAVGTITLHQCTRTNVPAGTVTQFLVPVPKSQLANIAPSTPKGRRRTLSYANAVAAGGRRGTVREWANMIHDEQEREGPHSAPVGGNRDYDSVPLFGLSRNEGEPDAVRAKAFIGHLSSTAKLIETVKSDSDDGLPKLDVLNEQTGGAEDSGALPFNSYDAIMVGTDNDFLESSKTRSLFKANAIKPEDVVLFEMPEFKGVQSEDTRSTTIIVQEQVLCDMCYPTPEQLANSSRRMQIFHGCKCYFAAVLMLVGVFLFIFLALVPFQAQSIHWTK